MNEANAELLYKGGRAGSTLIHDEQAIYGDHDLRALCIHGCHEVGLEGERGVLGRYAIKLTIIPNIA